MPQDELRSVDNPFTAEDHALIRSLRSRLERLGVLLGNMTECGMECVENKEIRDRMDSFLERIEGRFFSAGSTA